MNGVSFLNVPSFVLHGGLAVNLGSRQIRVDVAFGGAFYAIVDSEALVSRSMPRTCRNFAGSVWKSRRAIERVYSHQFTR